MSDVGKYGSCLVLGWQVWPLQNALPTNYKSKRRLTLFTELSLLNDYIVKNEQEKVNRFFGEKELINEKRRKTKLKKRQKENPCPGMGQG